MEVRLNHGHPDQRHIPAELNEGSRKRRKLQEALSKRDSSWDNSYSKQAAIKDQRFSEARRQDSIEASSEGRSLLTENIPELWPIQSSKDTEESKKQGQPERENQRKGRTSRDKASRGQYWRKELGVISKGRNARPTELSNAGRFRMMPEHLLAHLSRIERARTFLQENFIERGLTAEGRRKSTEIRKTHDRYEAGPKQNSRTGQKFPTKGQDGSQSNHVYVPNLIRAPERNLTKASTGNLGQAPSSQFHMAPTSSLDKASTFRLDKTHAPVFDKIDAPRLEKSPDPPPDKAVSQYLEKARVYHLNKLPPISPSKTFDTRPAGLSTLYMNKEPPFNSKSFHAALGLVNIHPSTVKRPAAPVRAPMPRTPVFINPYGPPISNIGRPPFPIRPFVPKWDGSLFPNRPSATKTTIVTPPKIGSSKTSED